MELIEAIHQVLARLYKSKFLLNQAALLIILIASCPEAISQKNIHAQLPSEDQSEIKPLTNEVNILASPNNTRNKIAIPDNFKSTTKIDGRTIFSGISAVVAIFALIYTVIINRSQKERDTRKSLYDELLFREMFFKPFNENLLAIINNWGTIDTTKKIKRQKQVQFLEAISNLRDMISILALITTDGSEKLQEMLDDLELLISSIPEEEMAARAAIPNIYKLLINIQEIMIKHKYKKDNFMIAIIE
ncbi:MAG: hypothetical protein ABNH16_14870 [Thalassolituus sp.]